MPNEMVDGPGYLKKLMKLRPNKWLVGNCGDLFIALGRVPRILGGKRNLYCKWFVSTGKSGCEKFGSEILPIQKNAIAVRYLESPIKDTRVFIYAADSKVSEPQTQENLHLSC
jgi:hypothetical protein